MEIQKIWLFGRGGVKGHENGGGQGARKFVNKMFVNKLAFPNVVILTWYALTFSHCK